MDRQTFEVFHQKQINCLIYLATRNMVDYFGPNLIKGTKLPYAIWATIAKKLNNIQGILPRAPKSWARTFVTTKFSVITKFNKFVFEQKEKHGTHYLPDCSKIDKLNMLLLHEYCTQNNCPNVPNLHEILNDIEKHDILKLDFLKDTIYNKLQPSSNKTAFESNMENVKQQNYTQNVTSENPHNVSNNIPSSAGTVLNADNLNGQTHLSKQQQSRKCRPPNQSYYLSYLAYLALKLIVDTHGQIYRKNCRLSSSAWNRIAKQMYKETGFHRPAEQWRKTFSSNKYVAQSRFLERLKLNGEDSSTINWNNVRVEELLYLQPLRHEGYSNMPSAEEVIQAYEQKLISLRQNDGDNFLTTNFVQTNNADDTFDDNTSIVVNESYNVDPVEIKTEVISDDDLSAEEIFEISEILDTGARVKQENPLYSSKMSQSCRKRKRIDTADSSKSEPSITTLNDDWSETLEYIDCQANFKQSQNDKRVNVQEPNDEHNYLERRLLEINEKLLNEKIKKNKILHKRNKLLKKQTKVFEKMCNKLDTLIDKKCI